MAAATAWFRACPAREALRVFAARVGEEAQSTQCMVRLARSLMSQHTAVSSERLMCAVCVCYNDGFPALGSRAQYRPEMCMSCAQPAV